VRQFMLILIPAAFMICAAGCTRKSADITVVAGQSGGQAGGSTAPDLAAKGKAVYAANCTACHNVDPRLDGSLGPAVAGSGRDLLERRILHADYPPGYTPKRSSKAMVALPHLSGDIDTLHAYLSQLADN
jgi:mono/diheme cytochrome c family protein